MTRSSHRSFVTILAAGAAWALLALAPLRAQYGPQLYGEGFGKNKIQYRNFQWEIYHSPHFNVYYYKTEEAQLQKVVSFAESGYDQLSRGFNFQIKEPIPLLYYATHSAFEQNNVTLGFIDEGTGAFSSPVRFRMVMPIDLADQQLMQLMLHEMTHIFQFKMLFQGNLARAATSGPPVWFMEGMASYMAQDESQRDKMYLRDAVVNDIIPSVTRTDFAGFFAYRFGHAVFDFVEERWGKEGFLDFIYEVRNTLGSRVDRAVKRAFKLEPEDFDVEFRRWLRKKYLPELVKTGEPSDFGRVFRIEDERQGSFTTSPVASPSGDLIAALSIYRGKVDVVLYDTKSRKLLRNLTKGYSNDYQYLAAQELVLGRQLGRDISFSPDGNTIAVFAKRERGRSLLLVDVLNGGVREIVEMNDIEQQGGPAFSPDGKTIAFSGWRNGQFDIFFLDLATRTITNFTRDEVYDGAPTFSPDGRSLVFVSTVGSGRKIFRTDLDKPGVRYPVTTGESNENDPVFSPDGKRLYFTSDRKGADNIFSLDLASGKILQHTDVVTGAFMPTVLREPEGKERLVYDGYWKMNFDLYVTEVEEPIKDAQTVPIVEAAPAQPKELPHYEPDIQVTLDPANKEAYKGRKFFLEDAASYIGVNSDQTYIGRILLSFSDYLGDHRIIANLSSIDALSNFDFVYADLSRRWHWQVEAFDTRTYYFTGDPLLDRTGQGRVIYQATGAVGSVVYPFSFYQRAELGVGYIYRKDAIPVRGDDPFGRPDFVSFSDDFPIVQSALVGDSSLFSSYGPIAGRRWRLGAAYAPELKGGGGTLFTSVDLDLRQYVSLTRRSNLAFRVFAGEAAGNRPSPFYIGGLDTLRGIGFRSLSGDRAFFANAELRFPLIDVLATPLLAFRNIRGVLFFDVGGAWYHNFEGFRFYNSDTKRLQDAIAAYGFGVTAQLFGLDLNWDFAKRFDLKDASNFQTTFWIGTRF